MSLAQERGQLLASIAYVDPRAPQVLEALREGLTAEIQFQLRLYRRQRGLFSFLGDRLIAERRPVQSARYDIFGARYVIRRPGFAEAAYADPQEFLRSFCALAGYPLAELPAGDPADYYVQARVRLTPVKMVSPLNIITLFLPETSFSSPWRQERL